MVNRLRVSVPLERAEARALIDMATSECRQPREQLRYLLRREARRRGLLSSAVPTQIGGDRDGQEQSTSVD